MTKIDMHIHSIESLDGNETPESIIEAAGNRDLKYISITDHNSIDAYEQQLEIKGMPKDTIFLEYDNGVSLVPGCEVTCWMDVGLNKQVKFHMLVYGYNCNNTMFLDYIRKKTADDKMVDWGIFNHLQNKDKKLFSITRQEIQQLTEEIKEKNHGFNRFEPYDVVRYFAIRNKMHESEVLKYTKDYQSKPRFNFNIVDVINEAHKAGAICLLAHPRNSMAKYLQKNEKDKIIDSINSESFYINCIQRLLDIGMDGVDISKHKNKVDNQIIKKFADRYVTTVGSDFHGFHSHKLGMRHIFHDNSTNEDFFEEMDDSRADIIDVLKMMDKYRKDGKLAPFQRKYGEHLSQDTQLFSVINGKLVQNKLDGKAYTCAINGKVKFQNQNQKQNKYSRQDNRDSYHADYYKDDGDMKR